VEEDVADARRQVDAFLLELETRYGIEKKQFRKLVEDLAWLREYRASLSRWGSWSIRSVIGAVGLSLGVALFEGIKILMTKQ